MSVLVGRKAPDFDVAAVVNHEGVDRYRVKHALRDTDVELPRNVDGLIRRHIARRPPDLELIHSSPVPC